MKHNKKQTFQGLSLTTIHYNCLGTRSCFAGDAQEPAPTMTSSVPSYRHKNLRK